MGGNFICTEDYTFWDLCSKALDIIDNALLQIEDAVYSDRYSQEDIGQMITDLRSKIV